MCYHSLVNQTLFRSAGCIVDHQHAERGSGNSGRYSASPAGMSAEPMALLWSHDIEVPVHKNVINNYLCVAIYACVRAINFPLKKVERYIVATMSERVDAAIGSAAVRLGFSELRPKQLQAVRSFVEGHDVFISLPTGSGKSLCYWVLPWTFDVLKKRDRSTVLVVSPLDALMKDQERSLQSRGVKAIQVGSDNTDKIVEDIKQGYYEILFISPERLLTSEDWRDILQSPVYKEQLVGVIVDEAHCVKKW